MGHLNDGNQLNVDKKNNKKYTKKYTNNKKRKSKKKMPTNSIINFNTFCFELTEKSNIIHSIVD